VLDGGSGIYMAFGSVICQLNKSPFGASGSAPVKCWAGKSGTALFILARTMEKSSAQKPPTTRTVSLIIIPHDED